MKPPSPPTPAVQGANDLVPRYKAQGYTAEDVQRRRQWLEEKLNIRLPMVGACAIPTEQMRGNVENPIGAAQMPIGIAGPLLIEGMHAQGTFYVPLATTEGALVRSYERGMALLTRAGGATTRVFADGNVVAPSFFFDSVGEAHTFVARLPECFDSLRAEAQATTRHGRLERVDPHVVGRTVIVSFYFHTADAQGMNMIVKAAERACRWLVDHGLAPRFQVFSGMSSEKRASGFLLNGLKGKKVVAGALIPAEMLHAYMRITPQGMADIWHHTVIGHLQANAIGYNGHYANGLAALFIACGQDVANVANSAVGITDFEVTGDGDLYASVTLPSLTVATVGGGTGLGTSRECLEILGCVGAGRAAKLAEIAAATLLAGDLSMAAAIGTGEFVAAHEDYGRNRPQEDRG
jgi:hydroxymethylglutaryl-CoA reductase (NADPH)